MPYSEETHHENYPLPCVHDEHGMFPTKKCSFNQENKLR